MERRSRFLHIVASGLLAVILISSAGCLGLFGDSDTRAGEVRIDNEDNQRHDVSIHVANGTTTRTVAAGSSETISIVESPGTYHVTATIDGTTRVNTTVEYYAAGETGDQVGGPSLILEIRTTGDADFFQSVD